MRHVTREQLEILLDCGFKIFHPDHARWFVSDGYTGGVVTTDRRFSYFEAHMHRGKFIWLVVPELPKSK
jgi:hypothetical protein